MRNSRNRFTIVGALLIAGLLLVSCGGTPTSTPLPPATEMPAATATPQPTAPPAATATAPAQPTATAPAAATATVAPTSPPQPTATSQPPATATVAPTSPGAAQRISFAAGATSATVEGSLAAQEGTSYVLKVMAGQLIEVSAEPQGKVQIILYGVDGTVLLSGAAAGSFFRGTVPSTQDYVLDVRAGVDAVDYTLNIIIPVRISFAPGTTQASVDGAVAVDQVQHYVLNVAKGQLMEVSVDPQDTLRLTIYGVDGTVLKSGMGGGAFFRGTVPSTQDYIVDVGPGAGAESFTMNVIIPVRISFAPGATSATVKGDLAAQQTRQYVLRASGGQTMEVNASPAGQVRLIIYGVDGTVLLSGMGDVASFSGTLPSDQDYIVTIQAGPGAVSSYTLEVSIQ
ncbi:MAG: hypothetical protein P8129_20125 [Anaerolineae bacterium]